LLAAGCAAQQPGLTRLRFSAPQGSVVNEFVREGPVAAHLVLTPGPKPRLIVAFPAGNSGTALFFDAGPDLSWQTRVVLRPTHRSRAFYGITADVVARGGPIAIRQAILGSVRVIRGFQDLGTLPPEVATAPVVHDRTLVWQRPRLDGAPGYYLALEVLSGRITREREGKLELTPPADGRLQLRVTALTADAPLTPIDRDQLFTANARDDARLRETLSFLAYREKLLAGSWRFNTYFGRDTLMSILLLDRALHATAIEAGLGAVLERLNAAGEVAHEEDIGEFAVLQRERAGLPLSAAALLDYKMVDDDFMLAPVAARYLLRAAPQKVNDFLERESAAGTTYGALLVRNLSFVVERATPFARAPHWSRLIALKAGQRAGNWRDSTDGLGGGRYPFDVNGVFVPAALEAIARLVASGRLEHYFDARSRAACATAAALADTWRRRAPAYFEVSQPEAAASAALERYAHGLGVELLPPLGAPLRFHAVALLKDGLPVPIANSDEAFALLLSDPAPEEAQRISELLTMRFPAGLMTDVGPVVANPAYAPAELAPLFDRNHYHGTVIWSWQQALLAAGLERQLQRGDLGHAARTALLQARARVRAAIEATRSLRASELWSWVFEHGRFRAQPFGASAEHETESNAAQLWSTVYLAQPR
jgi:hypothetical protein